MAKEKEPVHKVQMTDGKRQIIQQLLQESLSGRSQFPKEALNSFRVLDIF